MKARPLSIWNEALKTETSEKHIYINRGEGLSRSEIDFSTYTEVFYVKLRRGDKFYDSLREQSNTLRVMS